MDPDKKTTVQVLKRDHAAMLKIAIRRKLERGIPHHVTFSDVIAAGVKAIKAAK